MMVALLHFLPQSNTPVSGKPLVSWQIDNLLSNGVDVVYVYGAKKGDIPSNSHLINLGEVSLGAALAQINEEGKAEDGLIFVDAPIFFDVDFQRFQRFCLEREALAVFFAKPASSYQGAEFLITEQDEELRYWIFDGDEPRDYVENLTSVGIYYIGPTLLSTYDEDYGPLDVKKEILSPSIMPNLAYAYRSSEYVKDVSSLSQIEKDIERGIPEKRNLKHPQKAIFMDRDGTINHFGDFVVKAEMMNLQEGAAEAIRLLDDSEYLPICVTNQPIVARGETTETELRRIHWRMEELLVKEGAYLQDLFYCPHDIDKSKEWNAACECRKPKIGMLLKAKERYNIDFSQSWMIGDTTQDVQTGINAGCQSALLLSGDPNPYKRFPDAKATFVASDLFEAVKKILK